MVLISSIYFLWQSHIVDDLVKTPDTMKSGVIDVVGKSIPFTDLTISLDDYAKSSSKRCSSEEDHDSPDNNNVFVIFNLSMKKIKLGKEQYWFAISMYRMRYFMLGLMDLLGIYLSVSLLFVIFNFI